MIIHYFNIILISDYRPRVPQTRHLEREEKSFIFQKVPACSWLQIYNLQMRFRSFHVSRSPCQHPTWHILYPCYWYAPTHSSKSSFFLFAFHCRFVLLLFILVLLLLLCEIGSEGRSVRVCWIQILAMNGTEPVEDAKMEKCPEKLVYMWGYLPGASPEKTPILSPMTVRLSDPVLAGDSWKDVCGGGCGFAMAISGSLYFTFMC